LGRSHYIFFSNPAGNTDLHPVTVEVNPFTDQKVRTLSDHAAVEATIRVRPGDGAGVAP
jgi:hypothetical protein